LPAVALMCDIDRFKSINDQFGHEFGDAVLVQIGEVLNSFAKGHDILVGRRGGEEFVALMIGVTSEQAMEKAEKLRLACAEREVSQAGTLARVTISIGLAAKGGDSLSKMLCSADQALYAAKRGGRNRIARADVLDNAIAA
jgi:diguanylate cyclase (GGDEF)-like protein